MDFIILIIAVVITKCDLYCISNFTNPFSALTLLVG